MITKEEQYKNTFKYTIVIDAKKLNKYTKEFSNHIDIKNNILYITVFKNTF